jgi:hypothetical protein
MDFDLDELPAPEFTNKRLQQAQARNVAERIKAIWKLTRQSIQRSQVK